MSHIHYKFSSKLSYATVVFDSPHITLCDLKRQIMGREKLRAGDCDLLITSAQAKEEYTDDNDLIPKGSSVIVRRIPIIGGRSSSKTNIERPDVQHQHSFGASRAAMGDPNSTKAMSFFSKIQMANLVDADVSEEDKIKVMINQSAYDSINLDKKLGTGLSPNYTCYRCGNAGHHIRNCPLSGDKTSEAPLKLKKSTGIPRSFMVEVDDPNIKGAMLTNCGRYAIPAIDAQAYALGKREKPPFIPHEQPQTKSEEEPIPDELLCLICRDVLCDAVVIPCCGNSYCDDCIRTALLDSDEHVCPTCNQTEVSPDSLIANKFLRQAVNTFNNERGDTKSLGSAAVVSTPPVRPMQSQLTSHHSSLKQQDSVQVHPKAVNTPPPSLMPMALPTAPSDTPCSSPQPMQSHQDTNNTGSDGKTQGDSSQSQLASTADPTATDSLSLVNSSVMHTDVTELQQVSSSQLLSTANTVSQLSTSLHSPPSSSGCPPGGGNESTTQQLPPSSSSHSVTPPSLFSQSVLPTFPSAHLPHNTYPIGYNPTATTWRLPTPHGSPIPSLCSTANSYTQRDWYRHQRTRKERSPHRGSNSRRSPSHSHSKSSKSKSSQSYSCSSSRSGSRSRSRSQSKSRYRPHSPYSHRRDRHTRSRPSCSYSYGYKRLRSPTPSSSSSPRTGQRSRSKSPVDHNRSPHHRSKGSSSRCSTSRKGERSRREAVTGESYLYSKHYNQIGNLEFELDSERYLQWKKEYIDMCEKYFRAYVSQFHQVPLPPFLPVAPHHYPGWDDKKSKYQSSAPDPHKQRVSRRDKLSPSSQSSSYSRSPSQSSSDSRSTGFRSPSGSHSSRANAAKDRCSPTSQSSTDGVAATLTDDGARTKERSPLPLTHRKAKEPNLREESTENKEHGLKNTRKNKINECKEDKRKNDDKQEKKKLVLSEHDSPSLDRKHACDPAESVQTLSKPNSPISKHLHSKGKEKKRLETSTEKGRGNETHSKQDLEKHHKERTSKEAGSKRTDRKQSPVESRALDSGSQKKRRTEEVRVSVNSRESNLLVDPGIVKNESAISNRNPEKMERKGRAGTGSDIWEGGITVKPQKKISISINLDLKRKRENTDQRDVSCLEEISEKSEESKEAAAALGEDDLNKGQTETDENDKSESNSLVVLQGHIKQEQAEENNEKQCNQNVFTSSNFLKLGETACEDREGKEEQESNLWHYALSGEEENVAGTPRDNLQEKNMEEVEAPSLEPDNENTSREQGGQRQRAEPQEEKRKRWNEEGPTHFSQRNEDKTLDGENSVEDGSKPAVGGVEAEESPEIPEPTKTERENPSSQISNNQNPPDLEQVSSLKCYNSTPTDLQEFQNHPDTLPTTLPHLSAGKIQLEVKKDKISLIFRPTKQEWETGSVLEKDKKKKSTLPVSQRSVSPSTGKERRNSSSTVSKHREPSTERERPREREEKNRHRETSRVTDREKTTDKDGQHSYVTSRLKRKQSSSSHSVPTSSENEGRNLQQQESQRRSVSSSTCPDGNPPALRSKGGSATSRSTDRADHRGHKSHLPIRDSSPAWKHKEKYKSSSDSHDQSKIYRHQERAAASQHLPPSHSHSHSKEKQWLEVSGESSKQRSTQRTSPTDSKQARDRWELIIGDNLVKEGKSRRESHEEGSSRWVAEPDEREGETAVARRRELEEDGRMTSDTSRASAFRESCRMDEKMERKEKKQRRR